MTLLERFNRYADKSGDCWVWTGRINDGGYGVLTVNAVPQRAHRIAWTLFKGEIPDDLCVLHRCDNRPCCNPEHLFLGTRQDNSTDAVVKGRMIGPRGEKCALAVLTADKVREARRLHADEGIICAELARRFGVNSKTMSAILKRKNWKHVD